MKDNQKRVALVTGGSGFIGSHLVSRLIKEQWDVHVITRSTTKAATLQTFGNDITIHAHDGSTASMMNILFDTRPDVVFHLASLFITQHEPEDVEMLIESNIKFGVQLLEGMKANGIDKLIFAGTSWQHYENKDYCPVNLYAATKQAFESILAYYLDSAPLKSITLKFFDTYGPRDQRPKIFQLLQQTALHKTKLAMSPGEQLIDMVYIDDVVEAFMLAAERLLLHKVERREEYAVSSGRPIPLKELVTLYEKITCKKLDIMWGGKPYRTREVMFPWNKGKLLPAWKPEVSLEEGLKRMTDSDTE